MKKTTPAALVAVAVGFAFAAGDFRTLGSALLPKGAKGACRSAIFQAWFLSHPATELSEDWVRLVRDDRTGGVSAV